MVALSDAEKRILAENGMVAVVRRFPEPIGHTRIDELEAEVIENREFTADSIPDDLARISIHGSAERLRDALPPSLRGEKMYFVVLVLRG